MTEEIATTGINGIRNRLIVFSHFQKEEVIDVTANIPIECSGSRLAINRVVLAFQTIQMMYTGQPLNTKQIERSLTSLGEKVTTKEELDDRKKKFAPEFNAGTNKIGKGYRKIANTIMLTARADFHSRYGHDFMLYEYSEILVANSAISEELL